MGLAELYFGGVAGLFLGLAGLFFWLAGLFLGAS